MRKTRKILPAFTLLLVFLSVNSFAININDHIQVAVNQLGELSGYASFLTNHIKTQLAATPASNLNSINHNDMFTNGATFSAIDIVNGIIYIYLNEKVGLSAVDNRTIKCTPNLASTRQDGLYDTILSWTCVTDIQYMYANGKKYGVLDYLPYPLSDATYNVTIT
jgi:hypothetical protein